MSLILKSQRNIDEMLACAAASWNVLNLLKKKEGFKLTYLFFGKLFLELSTFYLFFEKLFLERSTF